MSGNTKDNKKAISDLKGWQKDILDEIDRHEDRRGSDQFQGLAPFALNKQLGVTVSFGRGAGHTTFANLIANKFPTLLIYGKMDHYKRVTASYALHDGTETISIYEIFHAMFSNHQNPNGDLLGIRNRFEDKMVIVVDNAQSVSDDIKNFIYDSANTFVVMLG